ncbi:hypothetical protein FHS07_001051 [Microbacterium proteolyticum]|uniref:Uncharacterized protein n=1 Tax=Microbacterium proteolyticum TaxID=1572644 RepID=A0A7W5CGS3_9MICO|nr:hypothetical protein [Microbacterium proteolyticum]
MTPALAAALARAEVSTSSTPVRVSTTRRTAGARVGVFRTLDGLRPRGEEKR